MSTTLPENVYGKLAAEEMHQMNVAADAAVAATLALLAGDQDKAEDEARKFEAATDAALRARIEFGERARRAMRTAAAIREGLR